MKHFIALLLYHIGDIVSNRIGWPGAWEVYSFCMRKSEELDDGTIWKEGAYEVINNGEDK